MWFYRVIETAGAVWLSTIWHQIWYTKRSMDGRKVSLVLKMLTRGKFVKSRQILSGDIELVW